MTEVTDNRGTARAGFAADKARAKTAPPHTLNQPFQFHCPEKRTDTQQDRGEEGPVFTAASVISESLKCSRAGNLPLNGDAQ